MLISRQVSKSLVVLTGILVLFASETVRAQDGLTATALQPVGHSVAGSQGACYSCGCSSSRSGIGRLRGLFRKKCGCSRCSRKLDLWSAKAWLRCKLAYDWERFECRSEFEKERFDKYLKDRFGYFKPSRCCGDGCKSIGKWQTVYAVNPSHFDQRDGRVWASASTGVPMVIPLAPGVRHQFNYSTGIPASRITHISRRAAPQPY